MAEMTYREALNQALMEEMDRDDSVFLMGKKGTPAAIALGTNDSKKAKKALE